MHQIIGQFNQTHANIELPLKRPHRAKKFYEVKVRRPPPMRALQRIDLLNKLKRFSHACLGYPVASLTLPRHKSTCP